MVMRHPMLLDNKDRSFRPLTNFSFWFGSLSKIPFLLVASQSPRFHSPQKKEPKVGSSVPYWPFTKNAEFQCVSSAFGLAMLRRGAFYTELVECAHPPRLRYFFRARFLFGSVKHLGFPHSHLTDSVFRYVSNLSKQE